MRMKNLLAGLVVGTMAIALTARGVEAAAFAPEEAAPAAIFHSADDVQAWHRQEGRTYYTEEGEHCGIEGCREYGPHSHEYCEEGREGCHEYGPHHHRRAEGEHCGRGHRGSRSRSHHHC